MFTTLCWAVFIGVCGPCCRLDNTCYSDVLGLYQAWGGGGEGSQTTWKAQCALDTGGPLNDEGATWDPV